MGRWNARDFPVKAGQAIVRPGCHVSALDWLEPFNPDHSGLQRSDDSIVMTGWGMSAHEQALMISSKVSSPHSRRDDR